MLGGPKVAHAGERALLMPFVVKTARPLHRSDPRPARSCVLGDYGVAIQCSAHPRGGYGEYDDRKSVGSPVPPTSTFLTPVPSSRSYHWLGRNTALMLMNEDILGREGHSMGLDFWR